MTNPQRIDRLPGNNEDHRVFLKNLGVSDVVFPATDKVDEVFQLRTIASNGSLDNREFLDHFKELFPGFNYYVVSDKKGEQSFCAFLPEPRCD